MPKLRDATEADVPRILDITNEAIANTTAIWDLEPMTLEARLAWFRDRAAAGFPILVAEVDEAIAGFGSYGAYHAKAGYKFTVEHSVYVAPPAQGLGLGKLLLSALIQHAAARGKHVMVGSIEAGNTASIALHKWAGFTEAGIVREAGWKFGRWLDALYMQKILPPNEHNGR